jgi:hypothetical protein
VCTSTVRTSSLFVVSRMTSELHSTRATLARARTLLRYSTSYQYNHCDFLNLMLRDLNDHDDVKTLSESYYLYTLNGDVALLLSSSMNSIIKCT